MISTLHIKNIGIIDDLTIDVYKRQVVSWSHGKNQKTNN